MMSEGYYYDEDFGMELQSLDSNDERNIVPRERIVLTPPREWLDPKKPLPTDKEYHRWISEQLRAHRSGHRQRHDRNDDASSCASDSSQLSAIGRAIQNVKSKVVAGVLRKRHNAAASLERQTLLEEDCFSSRDNGVVGMELSLMS
ncbi:expressed unknown protein [Seminavis robusta]|uniref:Uncharacterized protein n=1 Tax=Seminavis robusta TaxID=568900 RepID=A0A9N8EVR9_9STRA|nr:expressed unknown protein [Seminavis robusta]|eukprot:Sro2396_g326010.1 n/a (146) ;mRNA; r:9302-9739